MVESDNSFQAQMTDRSSFTEVERRLFELARKHGHNDRLATAVAHSFTQFVLDYITEEGVAQSLVQAGADRQFAISTAGLFARAVELADSKHEKPKQDSPGRSQSTMQAL